MSAPAPLTSDALDLSSLAPERREPIADLLCGLHASVPQLQGFFIHGSAWNTATQMPGSDVDLYWFGDVPEAADARLRHREFFLHQGIPIDCCSYWVGNLDEPQSLGVIAVLSLQRGHVVWENEPCFSRARAATRHRLADADWIADFVRGHLGWARTGVAKWRQGFEEGTAEWGWSASTVWGLPALSPGLLRPPSAARKGLVEIVDCSRRLGLAWYGELVLEAIGLQDIDEGEALGWCGRIDDWYRRAASSIDEEPVKHYYHITGMRHLCANGWHREAMWIVHRSLGDLRKLVPADYNLQDELQTGAQDLSSRLGHDDSVAMDQRLQRVEHGMEELARHAKAIAAQAVRRWRALVAG